MSARKKHRPHAGAWMYVYDGRNLAAVIQRQADGWHLITHPTRELIGVYPTRRMAVEMANARIARAPGAPVAGERERDAEHVKRIRVHQRQARELRNRRAGP